MSLDIYLVREVEIKDFNITHNLTEMARNIPINHDIFSDLYLLLWNWDEYWISVDNIIELLPQAITYMVLNKEALTQFNPDNWWWSYDSLLKFCSELLSTCQELEDKHEVKIRVWR